MHNEPREKLRELIIEYGRSLCDDPRRCEALLKDYCGQYKREIFVLISALKNRVAEDLLKAPAGIPQSMVLVRLIKRLEDELGLAEIAAKWAVESWALALCVIDQPVPVLIKPAPVSPIAPPLMIKKVPSTKWLKTCFLKLIASAQTISKITPIHPSRPVTHLMAGRYRDNDNGTVNDVYNGLQWMRFSLGEKWKDGTAVGKAEHYVWQQALDVTQFLNRQGGYAGYSDWRVPTKKELQTLIYCSSGQPKTWNDTGKPCEGNYKRPTIYEPAFMSLPLSWYYYWSSSTDADDPAYAWGVSFVNGRLYAYGKKYHRYVRLVRGGS